MSHGLLLSHGRSPEWTIQSTSPAQVCTTPDIPPSSSERLPRLYKGTERVSEEVRWREKEKAVIQAGEELRKRLYCRRLEDEML